jgi:uncharacterized protein YbjQ (UPF0145 family)
MTQDLPQHARERLAEMRAKKLFTSDLSVSEFLLVKEAGFDPLGLVMGSSIYQIAPTIPTLAPGQPGCEITDMTRALYHARELAMNRMEAEADALGADGVVGVRPTFVSTIDLPTVSPEEPIGRATSLLRGGHLERCPTFPPDRDCHGHAAAIATAASGRAAQHMDRTMPRTSDDADVGR